MKYQIIYCPNPDCVQIHVDQRLIQGDMATYPCRHSGKELGEEIKAFAAVVYELDGIEVDTLGIFFHRYNMQFCKGTIFSWDDILPHVIEALRIFIAKDGVLEEKSPPIHPSDSEMRSLREDSSLMEDFDLS